jgi:hypothetical protein
VPGDVVFEDRRGAGREVSAGIGEVKQAIVVVEHPLGGRAERGNDGFHGILSVVLSLRYNGGPPRSARVTLVRLPGYAVDARPSMPASAQTARQSCQS